jgi:uncharacterized membrane protein
MLRKVSLALAALFFTAAGVWHFLRPAMYMKIMPPYIPWPLAMVYISGAAEIAGGLGLLIRPARRSAALGLVVLLVAVFPANIYMATHPVESGAGALPAAALWGRLLLQPVFIWLVLWCTGARMQSNGELIGTQKVSQLSVGGLSQRKR